MTTEIQERGIVLADCCWYYPADDTCCIFGCYRCDEDPRTGLFVPCEAHLLLPISALNAEQTERWREKLSRWYAPDGSPLSYPFLLGHQPWPPVIVSRTPIDEHHDIRRDSVEDAISYPQEVQLRKHLDFLEHVPWHPSSGYRGVFDFPHNQSTNLIDAPRDPETDEAKVPSTSDHVLRFMGWTRSVRRDARGKRRKNLQFSGNASTNILDQREAWTSKWLEKGRFKSSHPDFVKSKPKEPCSICLAAGHRAQSEIPHKHVRPTNAEPFQIDKENLKPVPERSHPLKCQRHHDVAGVSKCKECAIAEYAGLLGMLADASRKRIDEYGELPLSRVDSKLRPWVRSQKHHDIDPNIRKLHALGRYKNNLHADYNSTEESYGESGDSSGTAAPIPAHKTGKYYGGDAEHPENGSNITGWAGYIHTGGEHFEKRGAVQNLQRFLIDHDIDGTEFDGSKHNSFASVFDIASEGDRMDVQHERDRMEHPVRFAQQPMCSTYPSLPKAYCSHCRGEESISDEPEEIDEEPISDLEPDVFEETETFDENEEPSNELEDDESEIEDEAIEAIESLGLDKPFESTKRPYALDELPENSDEGEPEIGGNGFADIDSVRNWERDAEGFLKPRKGRRTPWWCGSPQEPRTKEQLEIMKLLYLLPSPCWPKGTVIYPLTKDFSLIDLVAVTAAGERLIWKQVEELCKRIIEKDGKQEPGLIYKAEWDAEEWTGATFVTRHHSHWYGRSILNPDTAYKNKDYTYIDPNPILRTTGAAAEKEKEQQQANAEAITKAQKHPHLIPITIHNIGSSDVEKSLKSKEMSNELLIKYPDKTLADWKQARHQYRELAKKNGSPLARWKRALKASGIDADEPGIFALVHFPRTKERIYKIADVDDSTGALLNKFHERVEELVKTKIDKSGGRLTLTGDADLFRQRSSDRGFDPPTDKDIAIHELYLSYAQELMTRLEWRVQPLSADQAAAGDAQNMIFRWLVVLMYQLGFGVYMASADAPVDNPLLSKNWAEPS